MAALLAGIGMFLFQTMLPSFAQILLGYSVSTASYSINAIERNDKLPNYGYNETTMENIAEEVGVSKGTLYYFDSKEELFFELLLNWTRNSRIAGLD